MINMSILLLGIEDIEINHDMEEMPNAKTEITKDNSFQ